MKKGLLVALFLFSLFLVVFPVFVLGSPAYQTEIIYPDIGGETIPPQRLQEEGIDSSLWTSYFVTYIFRLLFILSFFIIFLVLVYGGIIYIISLSANKSVKLQSAKEWMIGAVQGALVISFSFIILSSIGNQFVLFRQIHIEEVYNDHTLLTLDWSLSNQYFQIPFGSIIEKAAINRSGKKNVYNVFALAKQAERTAHKIENIAEDLMQSLSLCSLREECDGVFGVVPGPQDPDNRPDKINIFADPINIITAKSYLSHDIYNFIDTNHNDFILPINNWQQGDIILGPPDAAGGISNNDFNAINGNAIRLYGEDRMATEMALRLAIRHNSDDNNYGYLEIKYEENHKINAIFNWNDDVLDIGSCPEENIFIPKGTAKIIVNPILNINNAPGKGFINIFYDEGSALCLEEVNTIWFKNLEGEWELRCAQDAEHYISSLPSAYNNINHIYCPQEYICENNTCVCMEDNNLCRDTDRSCLKDVDCRGTMHYVEQNGWINYIVFIPPTPEKLCPNLNYIIKELIAEAEYYDNLLLLELEKLYDSQGFINEGLYHLLKSTILKSLIFESAPDKELLLSYISFDFDRNYYGRDRESTIVTTYNSSHYNDEYYRQGGTDWSEWIDGISPNIEYIPHHNDPVTFYLKMDLLESSLPGTTNNIINSALEIALRLKEEGIHFAGDIVGLEDMFPPPPTDNFDIFFPPVDPSKTRISSSYGWRSSPRIGFHRGVDFARKDFSISNYPIYAVEDGIVKFAGRFGGYGNLIIIEHSSEDIDYLERNIQTYYGHLRPHSMKVVRGDRVERGDHIALMGSTGFSTGIHLHFEIREIKNNSFPWGSQVNPFIPSNNYNNQEYLNIDWWSSSLPFSPNISLKNDFKNSIDSLFSLIKNVVADLFSFYVVAEGDITMETVGNLILCLEEDIEEDLPLSMDRCREEIEKCVNKNNIPQEDLLDYLAEDIDLWEDILFSCGIDVGNIFIEDSSRFVCGNEIPVGEAFELTWDYLIDLLDKINIYIGEGQELLKHIRALNSLIVNCNCLCSCECYSEGSCYDCCNLNACDENTSMELTNISCNRDNDCDSLICNVMGEEEVGYCVEKINCCFENEIQINKESISDIREIMSDILYSQIKNLSHGFYNKETENVCEKINIDIINYGTTDNETAICNNLNKKEITRYDLIKRKLYLSREMLDSCKMTDIEGVFMGEEIFKTTIFGPTAESRNLQRKTKTEKTINVCCCEGDINNNEEYSMCPVNKPNQINTATCTASERNMGCETVTITIQQNTSNFNWFCCSGSINN